jgi:hypothetical protein
MQVCLRFWANESFRSGWGLLRNLVDHSHIRQKACGLWGFGHRAVVLTCFNQCARCPPEWTSEPGSIPTQTLSRTMLDSAATSVYPTACLRSPIGAASKAPSLCNHVSRDVHTARRTAYGWVHEIKHDGFRILARCEGDRIRLFTRNGYDFAVRFPKIALAVAASPVRSCVVDGERSSSIGRGRPAKGALALAFDERIQKDLANVL